MSEYLTHSPIATMNAASQIVLRASMPARSMPIPQQNRSAIMKKYVCDVCGYVYDPQKGDPDNGVPPGTAFENIPNSWVCPECGAGKDAFSPEA